MVEHSFCLIWQMTAALKKHYTYVKQLKDMPQINIKPGKAAAVLVLVITIGMFIAALSSGIIAEAGVFGLVWAGSCIAIIIFIIIAATGKTGVTSAIIETDGHCAPESAKNIEARLKKLDVLLNNNTISKEEYKRHREKILDTML
jgi:hypothetical protein